ncbi:hypothetical protein ACW0TE_02760, partial [Fusobacterium polymorphum]
SLAFTFKNIPVLPYPPETLIIPLFKIIPLCALTENKFSSVLSSITAIPDERESPLEPYE